MVSVKMLAMSGEGCAMKDQGCWVLDESCGVSGCVGRSNESCFLNFLRSYYSKNTCFFTFEPSESQENNTGTSFGPNYQILKFIQI